MLLVLICVFFHTNILQLRPAIPFDLFYTFEPWSHERSNASSASHNPELTDQIVQFYPWLKLTVGEVKQRRLPLWNPSSFCGVPLLANGQAGVFYPLKWFYLFFTPALASIFLSCIRLFAAGVFTFAYLRQLELRREACFFGAVVFMFSRNLIVWLNFPAGDAAVLLPGLFWICERFLKNSTFGNFGLGSVLIGTQFLAGQPQTSLVSAFAVSIYVAFRLFADDRSHGQKIKFLLFYCSMWLLGACLAAVQILPMLEYMKESAAASFRYQFNLKVYPWYEVISFIVPDFFGTPYDGNYWGFANLAGTACYVGIAPLILALLSLTGIARQPVLRSFWAIAAISFGIVYKLPLLREISRLPLFNATDTNKFLLVIGFSLSVSSAWALEQMLRREMKRRSLKVLLACLTLAGVAVLVFAQFPGFFSALRLEGYEKNNLTILSMLLIATFGIVYGYSAFRIRSSVFSILITALAYVDLFMFGHSYNAAPIKDHVPDEPPALVKVQNDLKNYRMLGIRGVLPPNTSMLYGIADIRGYDALTPVRYFNFLSRILPNYADFLRTLDLNEKAEITSSTLFIREVRRMFSSASGEELRTTLRGAFYWNTNLDDLVTARALDAFSIKFIVAPQGLRNLPRSDLELTSGEGASVFKNPTALPRTYLRRDFTITDDSSALDVIGRPEFDFRHELVVSGVEDRSHVEDVFKREDISNLEDDAQIVREDPSHIEISAEARGPRFLVLTDLYYPGWRAYLDGKPIAIHAANYLFRAILLPEAGKHMVRFEYRPFSFSLAAAVTGSAVLCVVALPCFAAMRRNTRHSSYCI